MSERVEFKRFDMFGASADAQEIKPCPGVIDETAALLGRQIGETADRVSVDPLESQRVMRNKAYWDFRARIIDRAIGRMSKENVSKQDILEALHIHSTDEDCQLCPYQGPACTRRLTEDVLALLEEVMRE